MVHEERLSFPRFSGALPDFSGRGDVSTLCEPIPVQGTHAGCRVPCVLSALRLSPSLLRPGCGACWPPPLVQLWAVGLGPLGLWTGWCPGLRVGQQEPVLQADRGLAPLVRCCPLSGCISIQSPGDAGVSGPSADAPGGCWHVLVVQAVSSCTLGARGGCGRKNPGTRRRWPGAPSRGRAVGQRFRAGV